MALVRCTNCGRNLITEADLIISQHRPQEDYISCGCIEFASVEYIMEELRALQQVASNNDLTGMNNALLTLRKKIQLQHETGHQIASPANQECKRCGVAVYTAAIKERCKP